MNILKNGFEEDKKEYPGNIWGWKFSFLSLGIIVVLLSLAIYRYTTLDQSPPILNDQPIHQRDSVDHQLPENN